MAWSYDPSQLATMPAYQVRLLIGDTLATDKQMQDEEIDFYLTTRANIYGSAAECCRTLATQFSRLADSVQGELRTLYSSKARAYAARAAEFENKSTLSGSGMPYAGGISIADKQNQESDTDRVPPQFNLGMDDSDLPVPAVGNETLNNLGGQDDLADDEI